MDDYIIDKHFTLSQEEILLPRRCNSRDLDPFAESVEVEFMGYNMPDRGPQSHVLPAANSRRPYPHSNSPSQVNIVPQLNQISEEPVGMLNTSPADRYVAGTFVPPPTYQAAVEGSDGAVFSADMYGVGSPLHTSSTSSTTSTASSSSTSSAAMTEDVGGTDVGGYLLRHRHQ